MLQAEIKGVERTGGATLVLMHFLGGSAREWDEVVALLGAHYRTVAVDLPGFGAAASSPGYRIAEMADAVADLLDRLELERYVLVGHSMSAKVAAVLARRFADRSAQGSKAGSLQGLVLVAGSPPGPEPMDDEKRARMLAILGEKREGDRERARDYITKNEERDIPPQVLDRAVDEVLRMDRAAWRAWLEGGSREDWAERVGVLELPTLVVAGEKDRSLGPEQQRTATMPHFAHSELKVIPDCSHLVPMEKPEELAEVLREFLAGMAKPMVPKSYRRLIGSARVSPKTREVLEERMAGPGKSNALSAEQTTTLRNLCARIVPQEPGNEIDLAGTIAARLASGKGDGWRFEVLPEDLDAYRQGLDALAAKGFDTLDDEAKDGLILELGAIKGSPEARWFEELRGDAVVAYMAHPATYARMGYSGIGVGGADTAEQGFVKLSIGEVENWEPESLVSASGELSSR